MVNLVERDFEYHWQTLTQLVIVECVRSPCGICLCGRTAEGALSQRRRTEENYTEDKAKFCFFTSIAL